MTAGLETFAKVRALHDRTTSPGEKAAAAGRMEALAKSAGMTVKQAKSKLDKAARFAKSGGSKPQPQTQAQAAASAFSDFFNTPEFRAERAERERKRLAKCEILLRQYGTEDAVFADTEQEAALRKACEHLMEWDARPEWKGFYTLAGWSELGGRKDIPANLREAMTTGWPWPGTVAAAWSEYETGEMLDRDRCAFSPDYSPHRWVEARRYLLEEMLDTHPAQSLNDLRARISWMEHLSRLQCQWTHDDDLTRLATLRADIERMGVQIRQARTSDERRTMSADDNLENSQVLTSPDLGSSNAPAEGGNETIPPLHAADAMASPTRFNRVASTDPTKSGLFDAVQDGQAQGGGETPYPSRRTNADKRRDVLALLTIGKSDSDEFAPLTDREIARRTGVSPQTVGNIRRSLA